MLYPRCHCNSILLVWCVLLASVVWSFGVPASAKDSEDKLGKPFRASPVVPGTVDSQLLSQLRGGMRESWTKYESEKWQGVISFDQLVSVTNRDPKESKWETHFRNIGWLAKNPDHSKLDCFNEKYSFSLLKQTASSAYQVSDFTLDTPFRSTKEIDFDLTKGLCRYTMEARFAAVSIWWVPLTYIMDHEGDKGFFVDCLQETEIEGNKSVLLGFTYRGKILSERGCFPDAHYWAILDPSNNWKVIRSGVDGVKFMNQTLRIATNNKYDQANPACPSEITIAWASPEGSVEELKRIVSKPIESELALAEEYYLGFYGISESSVGMQSNGSAFRLLVVGVIAIVIAGWLVRRSRM